MLQILAVVVVMKMFWMFVQLHMAVVWTVVMMGFVEEVEYHPGVLRWNYFSLQFNILRLNYRSEVSQQQAL